MTNIVFPIPQNEDEQRKFMELYSKLVNLMASFTDEQRTLKEKIELLPRLSEITSELDASLSRAGIDLTTVNSLMSNKFDELKQDGISWKTEIESMIYTQRSTNSRLITIVISVLVAIGLGIFGIFDTNKFEKKFLEKLDKIEKATLKTYEEPVLDWKWDGKKMYIFM